MPDALRLSALRAGYGETVILEDVSLTLPERGSLAVLGRNGVGKTTLMATIMGHTTFHGGEISFLGQSVSGIPVYERVRRGIGYVPQGRDIFPSLSVEENLTVASREGKRWTLERVYDLFPRLGERRHHRGNQISGGEQQMLAIGRALMTNPRLLLIDEATEGLAPLIARDIWTRLRGVCASGVGAIIVDRDVKRLAQIAGRAIVLFRGEVAFDGAPAALLADTAMMAKYIGL